LSSIDFPLNTRAPSFTRRSARPPARASTRS
jgi:hypothetical protein